MAEGFVLNIPQEMLNRLQKADEKIEKLDKNSRRVGENIRLAFEQGAKGVDKFIGSLNSAQKILDGFKDKKINVGLNLDAKAIDDLKKQLSTAGVNIPVGVTGTGGNAGGSNLSNLIAKIDTINQILNQILAQTTAISNKMDSRGGSTGGSMGGVRQTPYTQKQLESLNKKARTALYREELNALQRLTYAEKEKARVERENDKKNQIAHRQRMVELQQQEREIMRLAKAYRSMPSSLTTQGVNNLLAESKYASTVNQRIQAIKNLKNALKDISKEDANYKKNVASINKEIRRQEQELAKLGYRMNDVSRRSQNLFNISQQLGRALSLMFSVSQIGQYISKMVNVRKEMELQQRSLQVLLQSKDKANELWNQTLDLAVKSPFRVKELVTYTKQLAAYRIESDKLFETNKMLADVSAGLGVDMQRLILAFGQVKSASFLRGTELRQFTEAGIPMLEELSKYFSEIYGKSISVAEVFDMISKRMVTFTDVENVFQRMTSAGGVFFNMQEELSQTTAGMISNLQDSIDLMFNEIGKKNQGVINTAIKWARGLVDNWETIGAVMKGTLVTLLLYKTATMDINKSLAGIRAKWKNISAGFSLLKSDTLGFVSMFKGNIILTALTAIAAILAVIIKRHMEYKGAIKEIVKEYDKLDSILNNLTIDIYQTEDLDEAKQKLLELKNVAKSDFGINVDIQLQNLESIEQVREEFNKLEQQLKSMNDFTYVIKYQMVEEDTGKEKRERNKEKREANRDEDLTNDMARSKGITKDIEQLDKYSDRLNDTFLKVDGLLGDLLRKQNELNDVQKQFVEAFNKQGDTESDADFFNRRMEGLKLLTEQYEKFYNEVDVDKQSDIAENIQRMQGALKRIQTDLGLDVNAEEIKELLKNYNKQLNTVNSGIKDVLVSGWGKLDTEIARLENEMKSKGTTENEISESIKKLIETYYTSAIKSISTDKEWDYLTQHQAYLIGEQIAKEKGYTVKLVPEIEPSKDIELLDWQKAFNQEVEDVNKELQNIAKTKEFKEAFMFKPFEIAEDSVGLSTTKEKKRTALNEEIDRIKKEIQEEKIANANLKALLKSREITDEEYKALYNNAVQDKEKYQKYLEYLRDLLGGDDEKNKGGAGRDYTWKDRISLLRQLYDEFQKLNEDFGSKDAEKMVKTSFADAVRAVIGWDIDDIDFTTAEATKKNLEKLLSELSGEKEKSQLSKVDQKSYEQITVAIGDIGVEINKKARQKAQDKIVEDINNLIEGAELKKKYDELHIPIKWVADFLPEGTFEEYNFEMSLEDIRKKVQGEIEKLEKENLDVSSRMVEGADNTSLEEQLQGNRKVISELEKQEQQLTEKINEEQRKRIETYLTYVRNAIGEHAQIKLEEYNKLAEIEKMYAKKIADRGGTPLTNEEVAQKQKIVDAVKKETKGKEQKLAWEQFQGSETFLNIIGDLEQASNTVIEKMIEKLEEYKDQWTDMPLEDIKRLTDTINKLKEAQYANMSKDNIFKDILKTISDAREEFLNEKWDDEDYLPANLQSDKDIRQFVKGRGEFKKQGKGMAASQEAIYNAEQESAILNEDISQLEYYIQLLEEKKNIKWEDLELTEEVSEEFKKQVDDERKNNKGQVDYSKIANNILGTKKNELKNQQQIIKANQINLDVVKAYMVAQQNVITKTKNTQDNVGKLKEAYDDVVSLIGEFGVETENLELFGGALMDSFTLITNMIILQAEINAASVAAEAMGVAMNAAMGPIGWIVLAIQLIVKAISTILKAQDNAIVKQIELAQEKVDALRKEYEKLLKTIEEGYAESSIVSAYNQAKIDMQQMMELQQKMIDLNDKRKQKKEVKEEGKELRDEMEEMEEQLGELQEEYFSKITGGIIDDVLDASSTFVDAWLDAFRETGDGLSGLEDNFKEMFGDLIKQQASMLISEQFMEEWKERLSQLAEGGLTESEVKGWRDMVENDLPALNDLLKTFYSGFEDIAAGEGELTGLQRGIQGITEQQADILASYANSCRFLLASIDTNLSQLASRVMSQTGGGENPMLSELKVQTTILSDIKNSLNSVIKPSGYRSGGAYIKTEI